MEVSNAAAKFSLFIGIFTLIIYVTGVHAMEPNDDLAVSSASTYMLSANEIESLSKSALSGDAEAAFRLYQYFRFSRSDYEKAMYWVGISAKNGSSVGQYNFAFYLSKKGNFKEALYWANILKSKNDPDIDDLINSINEKMKENPGK